MGLQGRAGRSSVGRPLRKVIGKTFARAYATVTRARTRQLAEVRRHIEAAFDAAFYLSRYPDLAAVADPVGHYINHGWAELRDPAPWFSTGHYLRTHSDVEASKENPFYHYLRWGRFEAREICSADGLISVRPPQVNAPAVQPSRRSAAALPALPFPRQLRLEAGARLVHDPALRNIVSFRPVPLAPSSRSFDAKALDIHWVIPDFLPGLGGHLTIFRMVRWLELFGHTCTVWIDNPIKHKNEASAYESVVKHFLPVKARIRLLSNEFQHAEGDVVVATSWETAWPVASASRFKERFYFIQDYEPAFFPVGSKALAAELTYGLDFACICASPWLRRMMEEKHGRWARGFSLAADDRTFRPDERRAENVCPRIAFYARPSTPRRVVELGLLALEDLAARGVTFAVDFFGAPMEFKAAPFEAVEHGVVTPAQTAELYRKADIGLCFSATNYSLVPQEMMCCGLPVVEFNGESGRAVFPHDVVALAGPHPHDVADVLERLIADPAARGMLAEKGRQWVGQFNWEASARAVETAFLERLE